MRLFIAAVSLAVAVAAQAEDNIFRNTDVFELEIAADPQISPDGSRVAYSRTAMDIMSDRAVPNIWVVDADGRNHRPLLSGAGGYWPGIVLDQQQQPTGKRLPIALMGKTYCKVDADQASIEIGDLLTTSPTPGHAMRANDPFKAFGAVIGKALRSLEAGKGLIPVLVALQ